VSSDRIVGEHFKADGTPKRKFPTREAALKHVQRYCLDDKIVYQCNFCNDWHLATERRRG
jgi:hypothetical protein